MPADWMNSCNTPFKLCKKRSYFDGAGAVVDACQLGHQQFEQDDYMTSEKRFRPNDDQFGFDQKNITTAVTTALQSVSSSNHCAFNEDVVQQHVVYGYQGCISSVAASTRAEHAYALVTPTVQQTDCDSLVEITEQLDAQVNYKNAWAHSSDKLDDDNNKNEDVEMDDSSNHSVGGSTSSTCEMYLEAGTYSPRLVQQGYCRYSRSDRCVLLPFSSDIY